MDPDANLTEQLALARTLHTDRDANGPIDESDLDRLVELVLALNDWITRGGFLPTAWRATFSNAPDSLLVSNGATRCPTCQAESYREPGEPCASCEDGITNPTSDQSDRESVPCAVCATGTVRYQAHAARGLCWVCDTCGTAVVEG